MREKSRVVQGSWQLCAARQAILLRPFSVILPLHKGRHVGGKAWIGIAKYVQRFGLEAATGGLLQLE